ncbi:hypothetical protein L0657_01460 [Dyadobacter sp. CY345]|nr:hypothetical protein [Dyadobacter sp. CY345]
MLKASARRPGNVVCPFFKRNVFPELNKNWLILGEGDMLNSKPLQNNNDVKEGNNITNGV